MASSSSNGSSRPKKQPFYFKIENFEFNFRSKTIKKTIRGIATSYQQVSDVILRKVLSELFHNYLPISDILNNTWTLEKSKITTYFQNEASSSSSSSKRKSIGVTELYLRDLGVFVQSLLDKNGRFTLIYEVENLGEASRREVTFVPSSTNISQDIVQQLVDSEYGTQNLLGLEIYESPDRQRRISPEEVFSYQKLKIYQIFVVLIFNSEIILSSGATVGSSSSGGQGQESNLNNFQKELLLKGRPLNQEITFYPESKTSHKNIPTAYFEQVNAFHRLFSIKEPLPNPVWDINKIGELFDNIFIHLVGLNGEHLISQFISAPRESREELQKKLFSLLQNYPANVVVKRVHCFLDISFQSTVLESDLAYLAQIGLDTIHIRVEIVESVKKFAQSLQNIKRDIELLPFNRSTSTKLATQHHKNGDLNVKKTKKTLARRFWYIDEHHRKRLSSPYYGEIRTNKQLYKVAALMTGIYATDIQRITFIDRQNIERQVYKSGKTPINLTDVAILKVLKASAALTINFLVSDEETSLEYAKTSNITIPSKIKYFEKLLPGEITLLSYFSPFNAVDLTVMGTSYGTIKKKQEFEKQFNTLANLVFKEPAVLHTMEVTVRCKEACLPPQFRQRKFYRKDGYGSETKYRINFPDGYILEWTDPSSVAVREQEFVDELTRQNITVNSNFAKLKIQLSDAGDYRSFDIDASKELLAQNAELVQLYACPRFVKVNLHANIRMGSSKALYQKEISELVDKLHCPTSVLLSELFDDLFAQIPQLRLYNRVLDDAVSKVFLGNQMFDIDIPLHQILSMEQFDQLQVFNFYYTNVSNNIAEFASLAVLGRGFKIPTTVHTYNDMESRFAVSKPNSVMELFDVNIDALNEQLRSTNVPDELRDYIKDTVVSKETIIPWFISLAHWFDYLLAPSNPRQLKDPRSRVCLKNFLTTVIATTTDKKRNQVKYYSGANSEKEYQNPDGPNLKMQVMLAHTGDIAQLIVAEPWEQIFASATHFWLFVKNTRFLENQPLFGKTSYSAVNVTISSSVQSQYWGFLFDSPTHDGENLFGKWVDTFKDHLGDSNVITLNFDTEAFANERRCFNLQQLENRISIGKTLVDQNKYRQIAANTFDTNAWLAGTTILGSMQSYIYPVFVRQLAELYDLPLFIACLLMKEYRAKGKKSLSQRTVDKLVSAAAKLLMKATEVVGIEGGLSNVDRLIQLRYLFINQGLWPFRVSNKDDLEALFELLSVQPLTTVDKVIAVPELLMISGYWKFKEYDLSSPEKENLWISYGVWKYL